MTSAPVPLPDHYQPSADLLKDRVILITGASGALGSAASLACSRLGATVVLVGRTVSKLEKLYDEILAAGGPTPAILPLNLMTATWKEYEDIATLLDQEFGKIDGILHTAANFKAFSRLEDLEPREWLDSLQINLTGPYTLTRQCLPLLRKAKDASVVFVSDRGGREPRPFQGIYGISKAAVETMTATWALELSNEPGLRFNTIYPGPMRSGLRARGYAGELTESVAPAAEALPPLLWLLGPESRGISGRAF